MSRPDIAGFFDEATNTISYLVADPDTGRAAIVDPVLDFDPAAGRIATLSADRLLAEVRARGLQVDWLLETHVHADHLTAAPYLQQQLGCPIAIGAHVTTVQENCARIFAEGPDFPRDGSQFDRLFAEGERFSIGALEVRVLHTPGHTPADITYVIGDAALTGDTLFMPDFGTARCDFPGGSASALYRSIGKILALPDDTRLFVGHDYLPQGRTQYRWESTVKVQKSDNIHLANGRTEREFVALRQARDAALPVPRLIIPALQVNMRAGRLPPPRADGATFLKFPLNRF